MAIKNIICMGVGFSPGSTKYIPTLGYDIAPPPPPSAVSWKDRNVVLGGGLIATQRNPYNRRRY